MMYHIFYWRKLENAIVSILKFQIAKNLKYHLSPILEFWSKECLTQGQEQIQGEKKEKGYSNPKASILP